MMKKFVTTPLLLLLLPLFCMQVFAQNIGDGKSSPEFKNQGEQEDYWTKNFFRKEYKDQQLEVFTGRVVAAAYAFIFSGDSLFVNSQSIEMKTIFLKGLLYPSLIGGNKISDIEELKFIEKSLQQRRFKFLLYQKSLSNPTVCFFELTNRHATQKTTLTEFIRDTKLTFFKQGWIMI